MAKMLSVIDSRHVVGVLFGFGLVSENNCGFLSYLRFCHSGFFGVFSDAAEIIFLALSFTGLKMGIQSFWCEPWTVVKYGHELKFSFAVSSFISVLVWLMAPLLLRFHSFLPLGGPAFYSGLTWLWSNQVHKEERKTFNQLRDWFWPTGRGHRSDSTRVQISLDGFSAYGTPQTYG